jgi:hypothetical protein
MKYALFADGPLKGQWRQTTGAPIHCLDTTDPGIWDLTLPELDIFPATVLYRPHQVYILGRTVIVYATQPPSPGGEELAEYLLSPGALAAGAPPPQPVIAR